MPHYLQDAAGSAKAGMCEMLRKSCQKVCTCTVAFLDDKANKQQATIGFQVDKWMLTGLAIHASIVLGSDGCKEAILDHMYMQLTSCCNNVQRCATGCNTQSRQLVNRIQVLRCPQ